MPSNIMKEGVNLLPKEMRAHHYPILFDIEEKHWWYLGRRRIIQDFLKQICQDIGKDQPRVLDVGCGTGANLRMLAQYGQVEGVDISEQALSFCRERGLNCVKYGAAETLPYADGSFDVVTALDVVEHLDDDVLGLSEMRRVLRPGGRLLLFVPAFMFLWGVQDDVSNHRRRYTLPQLRRAVSEAGFIIHRLSYANITFFLPVFLVRSIMRLLQLRTATEYSINIPFLNNVFAAAFAAERYWLCRHNFPFGVSALCLAQRVD